MSPCALKLILVSLLWGGTKWLSYWPCFLTMSSCREKKRDHRASTKRVEYHVQFFSWNNESARLCKTMPSKDEYRKCIDTISKNKLLAEWKNLHQVGKGMAKKQRSKKRAVRSHTLLSTWAGGKFLQVPRPLVRQERFHQRHHDPWHGKDSRKTANQS